MNKNKKIVLVTGANRGLGLGSVKKFAELGYQTILSGRNPEALQQVMGNLKTQFENIDSVILDTSDEISIQTAVTGLIRRYGSIDVLVNNAGILLDGENSGKNNSIFTVDTEVISSTLKTNVFGPLKLCQSVIPYMKKNHFGRIVNVSSGMGQLSDMGGNYPAYRISKVSLNAVTRIIYNELNDPNILINSVCPGWVRTDMGGQNADKSIEEGIESIIFAATLPDGGSSGSFIKDKQLIPW